MIKEVKHPLTLGEQIQANLLEEQRKPIDAARERAKRDSKIEEFNLFSEFLDRVKHHIIKSVAEKQFPSPVIMTQPEANAVHAESWTQESHGFRPSHPFFPLWEDFISWVHREGIDIEWNYRHDGVGINSWWTLSVLPPKFSLKR